MYKKIIAPLILVVVSVIYIFSRSAGTPVPVAQETPSTTSVSDVPKSQTSTPVQTPVSTVPSTPSSTAVTPVKKKYKDGTYTGIVADAFYGPLQVSATIMGGRITDITFLAFPNDRPTSVEISNKAMPILKQEAIAAQSAQVDTVSSATQTTEGFRESLASALAKAVN